MNFDFSREGREPREMARRYSSDNCPYKSVRSVLEGPSTYDARPWKGSAEFGLLGIAIPEDARLDRAIGMAPR
jgi:hypothetical protein